MATGHHRYITFDMYTSFDAWTYTHPRFKIEYGDTLGSMSSQAGFLALFFFNCNDGSRISFDVEVHEYNTFNGITQVCMCVSWCVGTCKHTDLGHWLEHEHGGRMVTKVPVPAPARAHASGIVFP